MITMYQYELEKNKKKNSRQRLKAMYYKNKYHVSYRKMAIDLNINYSTFKNFIQGADLSKEKIVLVEEYLKTNLNNKSSERETVTS